jgi:hypothetical protein
MTYAILYFPEAAYDKSGIELFTVGFLSDRGRGEPCRRHRTVVA